MCTRVWVCVCVYLKLLHYPRKRGSRLWSERHDMAQGDRQSDANDRAMLKITLKAGIWRIELENKR
jgi:hypothetical protein